MNEIRRIKDVSVALADLAYSSGFSYNVLAEFCEHIVKDKKYTYKDALKILEAIFTRKEKTNEHQKTYKKED